MFRTPERREAGAATVGGGARRGQPRPRGTSAISAVDEAADSMPRGGAGLELWVRNQRDFVGF